MVKLKVPSLGSNVVHDTTFRYDVDASMIYADNVASLVRALYLLGVVYAKEPFVVVERATLFSTSDVRVFIMEYVG